MLILIKYISSKFKTVEIQLLCASYVQLKETLEPKQYFSDFPGLIKYSHYPNNGILTFNQHWCNIVYQKHVANEKATQFLFLQYWLLIANTSHIKPVLAFYCKYLQCKNKIFARYITVNMSYVK